MMRVHPAPVKTDPWFSYRTVTPHVLPSIGGDEALRSEVTECSKGNPAKKAE
jgi:hypothetical protein